MCQQLGWLVNLEKSELEPKQDFDFVGYQFDLRSDRVLIGDQSDQSMRQVGHFLQSDVSIIRWTLGESF